MFVQNSAPGNRRQTSIMKRTVSLPLRPAFAGKSKDDVERRPYSRRQTSRRAFVDGVKILKVFVHRLQDFGRTGFSALADLVQPTTPQQLQVFQGKSRYEIGCSLNAPLEIRAGLH